MSKVILEFNLPEEQEEFETAYNGHRYRATVDDIFSEIRRIDKYSETTSLTLEEIRELLVKIRASNFD